MRDAAVESCAIEAALARHGLTVLDLVQGVAPIGGRPGDLVGRVPVDGRLDPATGAQYFYHAHEDPACDPAEHGHFHCFLNSSGMPSGIDPYVFPELALAPLSMGMACDRPYPSHPGPFVHLIGLSLDHAGRPITLFTANQWVTGETWYRGADMVRMLDHYRLTGTPSVEVPVTADAAGILVGRWLAAVLVMLRPRIETLILARDAAIMAWRRRGAPRHVLTDRRLSRPSGHFLDFSAERARCLAG